MTLDQQLFAYRGELQPFYKRKNINVVTEQQIRRGEEPIQVLMSQPFEENQAFNSHGEPTRKASESLREDPAVENGDEQGDIEEKATDFEDKEASIIHELYARHFVPKAGREPRKEP